MADYPHASAACLCYLDEREGGEERERESRDAGHSVLSLFLCCSVGLSTLSCWPFDVGKRKKKNEGNERGEVAKKCSRRAGLLRDTSKRCLE